MIELRRHPAPAVEPGEVLRADAVGAWAADLFTALVSAERPADDHATEQPAGTGLALAELVDAIRALEELVCTATAAQAALSAELDRQTRAQREAEGVPADRQGQGIGSQVAHARRESPRRGAQHLGLAIVVQRELPHTWAAWRAGTITEWKATIIARETACLSLEDRRAVDAEIATDMTWLEARGDGELAGLVRAAADRVDAAAAVARRRKAESERRVGIRPAPDTMAWVSALLPVKDGVAVWAALTRAADTARAAGDERSRGQVMADTLVAQVTRPAPDTSTEPTPGPGVELGLVMTDAALFGTSEETAHLDGYGPIPAELAREMVRDAVTRDEQVWLRRLYASPVTGQLVGADARARLFRGSLARFIRLRDRICRTPWCDAPVRHIDHAVDHQSGGETTATNGQGTCEACNYAKQAPGWRAGPAPGPGGGHVIRTDLPTGHHYTSQPPMVARLVQEPLRVDFVLSG